MNISEIFGSNVFNETVMKERLPKKVFAEDRSAWHPPMWWPTP